MPDQFDNPAYLQLATLGLPRTQAERDRLLALLMADVTRFEQAALDGTTTLMPVMRPDARTARKRCGHALRAARPALERLGLEAVVPTAAEECLLARTMVPVSDHHDERMFIRGLQGYEISFALAAVQLQTAVAALGDDDADAATTAIGDAERTVRESAPLWSLVATMQPAAFLSFRVHTDGASAIQSRSYKLMESTCRRPDPERLDSPAYESVPEVRAQVLAGQATIDDTLLSARLTRDEETAVRAAMDGFAAAVLKWRQTHYRLAVRMLGDREGTGHTRGQSYLSEVRTIPVFAQGCPMREAPALAA